MDPKVFDEYLVNRYEDQIGYYEKASAKNQIKYKSYQWLLIILSTLTTILAALPSDNSRLKYFIVITAGAVTILSSALKTFQYQELWISYRSTIEQLRPELFYYKFNVGDYGQTDIDKETLFVTRIEGILGKERESWPIYKNLLGGGSQQAMDELQIKLDELAREKFKTKKPGAAVVEPPADIENTETGTETDVANVAETEGTDTNTGDNTTSSNPDSESTADNDPGDDNANNTDEAEAGDVKPV